MKKILTMVVVTISILATSCISIIEELTLNKDGSGTYAYTIDMTALMESGALGQARQMSDEMPEDALEIDTIMGAYSMLKEQGSLDDMDKPEFWKKVKLVSKISESKKVGEISFILDFDEMSEVDYFTKNLSKLLESDETAGMLSSMGLTGSMTSNPFSYKKGWFSRTVSRKKQENNGDMAGMLEEEGGEMVKMMLSGAEYITIYNLPGKVKSVSNDEANISKDGKTVTIKAGLLDQMEGEADLATSIKFKKN
ncbi:MAG: hypothetical protein AB8G11_17715 [Saprospiraceae bacterium]